MRIKALLATLVLGALVLAAAGGLVVGKEKNHVKAKLIGYEETPAIATTGHGNFRATIDEDASTISFEITYVGLETPASASHIHIGQRDVAGGVSAFFCGGGGKPACPAGTTMEATVSGTIVPADVIGPTAQGVNAGEFAKLVEAIRAGVTYANVHTSAHPGGEIRGQVNDDGK